MTKRQLLEQVERELLDAQRSADFWRAQLALNQDGPLMSAVEGALDNTLTALTVLHRLKEQVRNS